MSRRSNKAIAEILASSSKSETSLDLDRNITLATEGFTTNKFCELSLKDRNRLSIIAREDEYIKKVCQMTQPNC